MNESDSSRKVDRVLMGRIVCCVVFVILGVMHFVKTDAYMKVMPPVIPFHLECVYLSGLAEIIGGIMILFQPTRRMAVYGLIALLIAVFPANIYMAMRPDLFPKIPQWVLLLRLPFQPIFIYFVWKLRKP